MQQSLATASHRALGETSIPFFHKRHIQHSDSVDDSPGDDIDGDYDEGNNDDNVAYNESNITTFTNDVHGIPAASADAGISTNINAAAAVASSVLLIFLSTP